MRRDACKNVDSENLKERDHLRDNGAGIDGSVTLRLMLKELFGCVT
jgi:hypothetical protein